jgi:hypothetical protein
MCEEVHHCIFDNRVWEQIAECKPILVMCIDGEVGWSTGPDELAAPVMSASVMLVLRQVVLTAIHIWSLLRRAMRSWKRITRVVMLRGISCKRALWGVGANYQLVDGSLACTCPWWRRCAGAKGGEAFQ